MYCGFMNTITHYSWSCGTPNSNGTENRNNVSQFHAISSIRSLIKLSFKCLKGVQNFALLQSTFFLYNQL